MPGFDGTGPRGEGPMTGWGMGYCAQPVQGERGYMPPPRSWGWDRGFGMGRGRWFKWIHGMWPGFGGWGRGRGRRFGGGFGW